MCRCACNFSLFKASTTLSTFVHFPFSLETWRQTGRFYFLQNHQWQKENLVKTDRCHPNGFPFHPMISKGKKGTLTKFCSRSNAKNEALVVWQKAWWQTTEVSHLWQGLTTNTEESCVVPIRMILQTVCALFFKIISSLPVGFGVDPDIWKKNKTCASQIMTSKIWKFHI